jgi:prepilin peptidase CpaA
MEISVDLLLKLFLSGMLVIAAVNDLLYQKIPNFLTCSSMVIALIYHIITNGLDGLLFGFAGLILGITIFIIPYFKGGMGAGDVKLMGAVGSVLGPKGVFIAFLFTAIVGGFYALILLTKKHRYYKEYDERRAEMHIFGTPFLSNISAKDLKEPTLCYGLAIALGTLCYMFSNLLREAWFI